MDAILDALAAAGSMAWQMLWALILGFTLSAVIQAVVRKSAIVRLLGDARPRTLATAAGLVLQSHLWKVSAGAVVALAGSVLVASAPS